LRKIKVAFFADILVEDFDGAVRTIFQLIKRIDTTKFEYLFIYGAGPDKLWILMSLKIPAIPLPINTNYCIALPMLAKKRLIINYRHLVPM
jgi:hypothetical protein